MKDNNNLVIGVAVLLIVIFIGTCWCKGDKNDTFANTIISGFKNTFKLNKGVGVREYDIVYFMSPTCPWCKKMSKVLADEGILGEMEVVDVTQEQGKKMAIEMGAADKGVPSFISRKNRTGTVGFKKSGKDLLEALDPSKGVAPSSQEPGSGSGEVLKNLQIIVFVSPSCGWCTKMKQQLQDEGIMEMVELVDISTPEGQDMAKKVLPASNGGVPACYSKSTGKVCNGFKPIVNIIEELK